MVARFGRAEVDDALAAPTGLWWSDDDANYRCGFGGGDDGSFLEAPLIREGAVMKADCPNWTKGLVVSGRPLSGRVNASAPTAQPLSTGLPIFGGRRKSHLKTFDRSLHHTGEKRLRAGFFPSSDKTTVFRHDTFQHCR
jgi:hypothetical protein